MRPNGVIDIHVDPLRVSSSRVAALYVVPYPRPGCCDDSIGPTVTPRIPSKPRSDQSSGLGYAFGWPTPPRSPYAKHAGEIAKSKVTRRTRTTRRLQGMAYSAE